MSGIDISKAPEATAREDAGQVVHIHDEQGEPAYENGQPVTVRIAGTYSSLYRRTSEAQQQRQLKQRRTTLTGEQLRKNRIELVAACVLGWDGFTDNGQPFPCTKENAVRLLDTLPWVFEQLEQAQADHQGFFSTSSGS